MCLLMTYLHCHLFLVLYFPLHEREGLKEDNVVNIVYLPESILQHPSSHSVSVDFLRVYIQCMQWKP